MREELALLRLLHDIADAAKKPKASEYPAPEVEDAPRDAQPARLTLGEP